MKLLKLYRDNPNDRYLEVAAESLKRGNVIIYPTDSVYALGCDALNNAAIEKICRLKSIKSEKTNLSIICKDMSQVAEYAKIGNEEFAIIKRNTPGAFTFILPALSKLPKAFKGRRTVGVRIPDCRISTRLVEILGNPIMTTTIDFDDEDYGSEPELIAERYADVDLIIDAGRGGLIPTTMVDFTGDEMEIIREGKSELKI